MVICLERGADCHSPNVCVGSDVVLCQITLTLAVPVAAESTEADVVFCYVLFAGIVCGRRTAFAVTWLLHLIGLQCFDAVGWVAGRASGL